MSQDGNHTNDQNPTLPESIDQAAASPSDAPAASDGQSTIDIDAIAPPLAKDLYDPDGTVEIISDSASGTPADDEGPFLTLADGSLPDEADPVLENAFVGDVADDAAELIDESLEVDSAPIRMSADDEPAAELAEVPAIDSVEEAITEPVQELAAKPPPVKAMVPGPELKFARAGGFDVPARWHGLEARVTTEPAGSDTGFQPLPDDAEADHSQSAAVPLSEHRRDATVTDNAPRNTGFQPVPSAVGVDKSESARMQAAPHSLEPHVTGHAQSNEPPVVEEATHDPDTTEPADEVDESFITSLASLPDDADHVIHDVADETDEDQDDEEDLEPVGSSSGGFFTIPLLCLGVAIIACCLIIPQVDANRRLAYERSALRQDLEQVQAQVATNDEFLRKLAGDPQLAERLAQRQMKMVRSGTKLLPIGQGDAGTSPFDLVQVSAPQQMEPYQPIEGPVASLCNSPRTRLYLMGGGLFLMAAGLVLGLGGPERRPIIAPPPATQA